MTWGDYSGPADAPLIDAEILFRQPGPAQKQFRPIITVPHAVIQPPAGASPLQEKPVGRELAGALTSSSGCVRRKALIKWSGHVHCRQWSGGSWHEVRMRSHCGREGHESNDDDCESAHP
jgi:hypothetical protein